MWRRTRAVMTTRNRSSIASLPHGDPELSEGSALLADFEQLVPISILVMQTSQQKTIVNTLYKDLNDCFPLGLNESHKHSPRPKKILLLAKQNLSS